MAQQMNDMNFTLLTVNEKYPLNLPAGEGAISEFLRPAGNRLLIVMPEILDSEAKALRKGDMRGGLLYKNGALLFVWQFFDKNKRSITLDSPFDARVIKDIQLHDVTSKETRLSIDVHVVDSKSKLVRGLRRITMPPGLTLEFFSAVQDQISDGSSGEQQYQHWQAYSPQDLAKKTQMWLLGG